MVECVLRFGKVSFYMVDTDESVAVYKKAINDLMRGVAYEKTAEKTDS